MYKIYRIISGIETNGVSYSAAFALREDSGAATCLILPPDIAAVFPDTKLAEVQIPPGGLEKVHVLPRDFHEDIRREDFPFSQMFTVTQYGGVSTKFPLDIFAEYEAHEGLLSPSR